MMRGQAAAASDCWKSLTKRFRSMTLPSLQSADANVGIDHHDGFDVTRNALQQAADRAGLAPVDAVVETAPSRLRQPQHGVVGRPVADEPYAIFIRSERLE
jgi:hypothetical protein